MSARTKPGSSRTQPNHMIRVTCPQKGRAWANARKDTGAYRCCGCGDSFDSTSSGGHVRLK